MMMMTIMKNYGGGWVLGGVVAVVSFTVMLLLVLLRQRKRFVLHPFLTPSSSPSTSLSVSDSTNPNLRTSKFVTDADLKFLIETLDEKLNESDKWEDVIDKRNQQLCYTAKCCKPKWDKTVFEYNQLQAYESKGVEVGRTVKKFPLLRPREYVLSWKLWEGQNKSFYCFMKECEHPLAPRQKKYVRVELFRSGWRIREVPGRNACEITMLHQEDAGLNMEMAKVAFSKGIWNYVCKMDSALRRYSVVSCHLSSSVAISVSLMQKVPPCLEPITSNISGAHSGTLQFHDQAADESPVRMISRWSSRKLLANSILILGGAFCLSRGHSSLGAKVVMAYILTKLTKRGGGPKTNQSKQS
ncbi:hypothetical protein AAHE18_04G003300 [Arachis hypogaea]